MVLVKMFHTHWVKHRFKYTLFCRFWQERRRICTCPLLLREGDYEGSPRERMYLSMLSAMRLE